MATLDLSNAKVRIDMTDPNLVGFGAVEYATPTLWSYLTPTGHDLELNGQGLTFDAQGRALSGTITSIGIDLGNNDFDTPDIVIAGINAAAATLDDGAASFWRFLEGDDTIVGPDNPNLAESNIFGDGVAARAGASTGGNDTFEIGDSYVNLAGDVWTVGSQTSGTPPASYRGGSDTIVGGATAEAQALLGDVYYVYATGDLAGGNDIILSQSTRNGSAVAGDAGFVEGIASDLGTVTGGNDVITGGSGSEASLVGDVYVQKAYSFVRGGNDIIKGSDAREYIIGDVSSVGDNQMIGGADRLWAGGGNDVVFGDFETIGAAGQVTGGNDTIRGGVGDDYIYGDGKDDAKTTGGDDRLFGEVGNDGIAGGTGNDLLDGGVGRDNLQGGAGNDTYVIDNVLDYVYEEVGQGTDLVRSYLGDVTLRDNVENLTFIGNGAFLGEGNDLANTIKGGAGADNVNGRGGADRLFGGAGDDVLFGDTDNDVLTGGAGGDFLVGADGFDVASYASSEHAVKVALDGAFAASGDAVGDTFTSLEGLQGSGFNDRLRGDANANRLSGGAGIDKLEGGAGDDRLVGETGNDALYGEAGLDTLEGGDGNDLLNGGAGGDRLDGAAGTDVASYSLASAGVTASLAAPGSNTGEAAGDTYVSIEGLFGSAHVDRLTGDAAANTLYGSGGNDFLYGVGGADTLLGGIGNDVLDGGTGGDRLDGADGTDFVSYSLASAGVTASLANPAANTGEAQGDTYASIEGLFGSAFNDRLAGDAGANTIVGALGRDTLEGGLGADTFDFNAVAESSAANRDVIADFNGGTAMTVVDRIDLSGIDARTNAAGDQAFTFIGSGPYTGVAGQLRVVQSGPGAAVFGDVNGDGASDFQLTIANGVLASLTAIDFIL